MAWAVGVCWLGFVLTECSRGHSAIERVTDEKAEASKVHMCLYPCVCAGSFSLSLLIVDPMLCFSKVVSWGLEPLGRW